MPHAKRRLRLWLVSPVVMLAALGLITAGCGAESPSAEEPATSEATPTGPDGSSGQPAETGGFIPQREFTIGKTRDDGSSYELTLGFGDPVRAGSVDPSLYGAPNCRTDSERSAIIPARLTVKNTTPGYGIDTDIGLRFEVPPPEDPGFLDFSSAGLKDSLGVDSQQGGCAPGTGVAAGSSAANIGGIPTLASGEEGSVDFSLVFSGYFSPASPDGHAADLSRFLFSTIDFDSGLGGDAVCITGPGVGDGTFFSVTGQPVSEITGNENPLPTCGVSDTRQTTSSANGTCPQVEVLYAVGSGNRSNVNNGRTDEVTEVFADEVLRPERDAGDPSLVVSADAVNYPAVSVVGITGAGAGLKFPGPYHDSVVRGKQLLHDRISALVGNCPRVRLVLAGFSQGAQVVGDVYQDLERSAGTELEQVSAVVLFGDPYFNPNPNGRGSSMGALRHDEGVPGNLADRGTGGALGRRPEYSVYPERVRSYCHAKDPVCQSGRRQLNPLQDHLNYTTTGEATDAARWVSTQIRASLVGERAVFGADSSVEETSTLPATATSAVP